MSLQTKNSGEAIKFHLNPAQLARLQNAQGLYAGHYQYPAP